MQRPYGRPLDRVGLTLAALSTGAIATPLDLLSLSKRKLETYAPKLGTWDELFAKTGADLRETGMTTKERRYCLWFLEKFRCAFGTGIARAGLGADAWAESRQGQDPSAVAIAQKPKKKVRSLDYCLWRGCALTWSGAAVPWVGSEGSAGKAHSRMSAGRRNGPFPHNHGPSCSACLCFAELRSGFSVWSSAIRAGSETMSGRAPSGRR